jgi:predicted metalloprotease with PDZ domain
MNKFLFVAACAIGFLTASAQQKTASPIRVSIDINDVKDDKVGVTMIVPAMASNNATLHFPSIIPGTYSKDDYARFVEGVKAFDKNGTALTVTEGKDRSWTITDAKKLAKITYLVNDTYDISGEKGVFSPAGTNILDKKNFVLNLHGFVGYFTDMMSTPYEVTVVHPANLSGATSLIDTDKSDTKDVFSAERYFDVTDNPIMYTKPDQTTFNVGGMEVVLSVYSPNGTYNAQMLTPEIEKMMQAQKAFLGDINKNKRYTVLLYLSEMMKPDAQGFGALEHNTSTTVVFPEMMPKDQLVQMLIDVVSHEFFHTVTPLSVHSKEIHYFDYTTPKMSEHLWMYEGVTEYFANLFQVNQGLITEDEFYTRMAGKISNASEYDDKMSFTEMSRNVIDQPYKKQYNNVYEKGALIAMCLDIIIREQSGGERGILDLMRKLSDEYGANKPFDDAELFPKIIALTYPQVGEFIKTHIEGKTPIPYDEYFAKVGVGKAKRTESANPFLKGQMPYITIKPGTKDIVIINGIKLNTFMNELKLEGGDVILKVNGTAYNLDNIYNLVMEADGWKAGDDITIDIKRDDKPMTLKGKVKLDTKEVEGYGVTDKSKEKLREAWLKK